MQFTKVDDDAYTVLVNLDTIRQIGLSLKGESDDTDRAWAIGAGFRTAHERLTQLNTLDETVEVSDTSSE